MCIFIHKRSCVLCIIATFEWCNFVWNLILLDLRLKFIKLKNLKICKIFNFLYICFVTNIITMYCNIFWKIENPIVETQLKSIQKILKSTQTYKQSEITFFIIHVDFLMYFCDSGNSNVANSMKYSYVIKHFAFLFSCVNSEICS